MKYSRVLVALQFSSIAIIVFTKDSSLVFSYWWVFTLIATILTIWIFMHNRLGNFNIVPEIKDSAKLITSGPYSFVRHPMYSALILFMFGILLNKFSLITVSAFFLMVLVVLLKAKKEELLWKNSHKDYESYMKKTKIILPFII